MFTRKMFFSEYSDTKVTNKSIIRIDAWKYGGEKNEIC